MAKQEQYCIEAKKPKNEVTVDARKLLYDRCRKRQASWTAFRALDAEFCNTVKKDLSPRQFRHYLLPHERRMGRLLFPKPGQCIARVDFVPTSLFAYYRLARAKVIASIAAVQLEQVPRHTFVLRSWVVERATDFRSLFYRFVLSVDLVQQVFCVSPAYQQVDYILQPQCRVSPVVNVDETINIQFSQATALGVQLLSPLDMYPFSSDTIASLKACNEMRTWYRNRNADTVDMLDATLGHYLIPELKRIVLAYCMCNECQVTIDCVHSSSS